FTAVGELVQTSPQVIRADEIDWEDQEALAQLFETMNEARTAYAAVVDDAGVLLGALTPKSLLRSSIYTPNLDDGGRLKIATAIGVNGNAVERASALVE
ncbi:GuaB1 family IMP dehydrogenase-related protein, partial [Burkholderia multivorans]